MMIGIQVREGVEAGDRLRRRVGHRAGNRRDGRGVLQDQGATGVDDIAEIRRHFHAVLVGHRDWPRCAGQLFATEMQKLLGSVGGRRRQGHRGQEASQDDGTRCRTDARRAGQR